MPGGGRGTGSKWGVTKHYFFLRAILNPCLEQIVLSDTLKLGVTKHYFFLKAILNPYLAPPPPGTYIWRPPQVQRGKCPKTMVRYDRVALNVHGGRTGATRTGQTLRNSVHRAHACIRHAGPSLARSALDTHCPWLF